MKTRSIYVYYVVTNTFVLDLPLRRILILLIHIELYKTLELLTVQVLQAVSINRNANAKNEVMDFL